MASTFWVSLPSSRPSRPRRPCEAITIRSQPSSRAAVTMARCGEACSTACWDAYRPAARTYLGDRGIHHGDSPFAGGAHHGVDRGRIDRITQPQDRQRHRRLGMQHGQLGPENLGQSDRLIQRPPTAPIHWWAPADGGRAWQSRAALTPGLGKLRGVGAGRNAYAACDLPRQRAALYPAARHRRGSVPGSGARA